MEKSKRDVEHLEQVEQVERIDTRDESYEDDVVLSAGFFEHKSSLIYCVIVAMGGFQLGIDLAAVGGLQAMPGFLKVFGYVDPSSPTGYGIDPTVQQLISSLMSLGTIVGALFVGALARWINRRFLLIFGYILCCIGIILMMVATGIPLLYTGRLLNGIGNGFLQVVPQLYVQECAPAIQRGSLVAFFLLQTGVGQLIGAIIDNYTSPILGKASYQIPLGTFLIIPTIVSIILPFIPESPRWLVAHGHAEAARESIRRLRNKNTSPEIIDAEFREMQENLIAEQELAGSVSPWELFHKPNIRQTMLSLTIFMGLGGTGSLLFQQYGTYFFQVAGQSDPFVETVGITATGVAATLIGLWLVTKVGRRRILLSAYAAQSCFMLLIAGAGTSTPMTNAEGKAMVAGCFLFMFTFNLACAPLLYLVATEMPSQRLRSYTVGLSFAVAFITNWLCTFTAPYFINATDLNWGPKYCYIWFASNAIIFVYFYFFLPETKDRTLEEIDEMFREKVPARKFRNYVCTQSIHARGAGAHRGAKEIEIDIT